MAITMNSLKQNEMTQCDSCFEHYQCGKKQGHKGNHIWKTNEDGGLCECDQFLKMEW